MPKAKFTERSAAEAGPGKALELDLWQKRNNVPARRSSPAQRQGAADIQATATAADPMAGGWTRRCSGLWRGSEAKVSARIGIRHTVGQTVWCRILCLRRCVCVVVSVLLCIAVCWRVTVFVCVCVCVLVTSVYVCELCVSGVWCVSVHP